MTSQRQMSQVCVVWGTAAYQLKLHDMPLARQSYNCLAIIVW